MSNEKYKNKYRIQTTRLKGYDYGTNGCYFVTICTKNRIYYLGKIVDSEMRLSEIGEIADKFWLDIPNHFPFVILDQFIIKPNHMHGILIFNKNDLEMGNVVVETDNYPSGMDDTAETDNYPSLRPLRCRQSQNLGSVIRGFKSSLKRYANENNIDFAWQERFHDRIIRNNKELGNVRKYIFNNPANWNADECHRRDG